MMSLTNVYFKLRSKEVANCLAVDSYYVWKGWWTLLFYGFKTAPATPPPHP